MVFNMCENGCCIFHPSNPSKVCSSTRCSHFGVEPPLVEYKQLSLIKQLSHFLAFANNRAKLEYGHHRRSMYDNNHTRDNRDFFDGEAYRKIKGTDHNRIMLAMHVDGFNPYKRIQTTMTIVMFTILNLAPEERYYIKMM